MNESTVLSLKNLTKQYPGVLALDRVSLDFAAGEVHALLGENGAGKSTLIKAVAGAIEPDDGVIRIDGNEYAKMTPHLARRFRSPTCLPPYSWRAWESHHWSRLSLPWRLAQDWA